MDDPASSDRQAGLGMLCLCTACPICARKRLLARPPSLNGYQSIGPFMPRFSKTFSAGTLINELFDFLQPSRHLHFLILVGSEPEMSSAWSSEFFVQRTKSEMATENSFTVDGCMSGRMPSSRCSAISNTSKGRGTGGRRNQTDPNWI